MAGSILEKVKGEAEYLRRKGVIPTLAIIRVGENPSDLAYERSILKCAGVNGISVRQFLMKKSSCREEIINAVEKINSDERIHGALLFRPLADKAAENDVCRRLSFEKDVDGITDTSASSVFTDEETGFAPCTAKACVELLKYYNISLSGKRVTVIGRSMVIGKPVSMLLLKENATVKICHSKTADLREECRWADIIVTAAGSPRFLDDSYVNGNQIIIDVGINVDESGKLCGDTDYDSVLPVVSGITPVYPGVGTVTTAVLMSNIIFSAKKVIS